MTSTITTQATCPTLDLSALFTRKPLDRGHMTDAKRYAANEEPQLADLLTDPMVRSLMDSDGVAEDSLSQLLHCARSRLQVA
jgi:hypothetical protein